MNMETPYDAKPILRKFVTENFLASSAVDSFEDADSFLEKGIIDSTGVLELLEFIEGTFGFRVEDEEVVPANLDSLDNLAAFIKRKSGLAGQ